MSAEEENLFKLFGQLIQHRNFSGAALETQRQGDWRTNWRGPARLLKLMTEKKNWTNAEIASALDIKPSSVSALVSRLEQAELVSRHASEDDKRVMLITLTDKGRNMIAQNQEQRADFSKDCFDALTADEKTQLAALLKKLNAHLDDVDPKPDMNEASFGQRPEAPNGFGPGTGAGFGQGPEGFKGSFGGGKHEFPQGPQGGFGGNGKNDFPGGFKGGFGPSAR